MGHDADANWWPSLRSKTQGVHDTEDSRDDMLLQRSRPQSKSSEPPAMQPVKSGGARRKLDLQMLSCLQAVRARLRVLKR